MLTYTMWQFTPKEHVMHFLDTICEKYPTIDHDDGMPLVVVDDTAYTPVEVRMHIENNSSLAQTFHTIVSEVWYQNSQHQAKKHPLYPGKTYGTI